MLTQFIRLLHSHDKEGELLSSILSVRVGEVSQSVFQVPPDEFLKIPTAPFAYWVSDSVRDTFESHGCFESESRIARVGLQTSDGFRYVRLYWEVEECRIGEKWFSFSKGGNFSVFFSDLHLVVNWLHEGKEIRNFFDPNSGRLLSRPQNREYYFNPGLTWTYATTSPLSVRALPRNSIFSNGGPCATRYQKSDILLLCDLALLNSKIFGFLVSLQVGLAAEGRKNYDVGIIQRTAMPDIASETAIELADLALGAWRLTRFIDTVNETSHVFVLPAALRNRVGEYELSKIVKELKRIQSEIDDIAFDLYGCNESDRATILGGLKEKSSFNDLNATVVCDEEGVQSDAIVEDIEGLLSWCVGVAFGRFDWRFATGMRSLPLEPEPFDPIPVKSPGMLPDGDTPFFRNIGILVDDPGHPNDLGRLVETIMESVNVRVPLDVRRWLRRDFFSEHLKQYSMSRRKAPIYWPLSIASGGYTLWIHYSTLTSQTLYIAVNDFLDPKLVDVASDVQALRNKRGRTKQEEDLLQQLQNLELELHFLRKTILEIAKDYSPNHEDGVQITAAPLWSLFQNKVWRKLLKGTWTKLEKGDYDWAHLAMSYWPNRVREKCTNNKSLSIAHGIEELYEAI